MSERDTQVQGLFNRITASYDRINGLMTLGHHARWCREVAARAGVPPRGRLLDIATGTGEIALAARRREPRAEIVGVDFSEKMLEEARTKPGAKSITWEFADAHSLRFEDASFDAVTHGYLLRNVSDVPRVLAEQARVLKPGGRVVVLETAPPRGVLRLAVSAGMGVVLPLLGRLVAGDRDAYSYLKDSTLGFVPPERVAELVREAGFEDVGYERKYLGTNVILWGRKPAATN
ncbi:demethylmenaquinone methyltransferase [Kocuria varians]|uniref:Demethylmenaquinone methyltransferase n=1 Tax=Kocuria varians TaxID=1272 RepID=A0A4Y4CZT9_KOCVA|nr:class I SAM-dependent methyltransferase [Kocuria varians]GEC98458.1 demethylmenaquinone methyltransferase [Kocuria varians]